MRPALTQLHNTHSDDKKNRISWAVEGFCVVYFMAVAEHFHYGNEENHENIQTG
jgi:hypothetical protein